jgi:hypothetical protein
MTPRTLSQVLADQRAELPVLRKHGQTTLADAIERLCDDVAEAGSLFLEYLSEPEAQLRSGKSTAWLRRRFPEWQRQGLARLRNGAREYLKVVVPHALDVDALRADARRAAQKDAAA